MATSTTYVSMMISVLIKMVMVIMVIEDDAADAYDGNAAEDDVEENKTLIPLSEIVKATLSTFLSCF